jgi:hypothetical protein
VIYYATAVELALNLVWLLIACGSVLAWTAWRRSSDSSLVPELGRGLLIILCILAVVLPAVSITDDLAQGPLLADDVRTKDLLNAPEYFIQFLTAAIFVQLCFSAHRVVLWRNAPSSQGLLEQLFCWSPNIEKRPPPSPSI